MLRRSTLVQYYDKSGKHPLCINKGEPFGGSLVRRTSNVQNCFRNSPECTRVYIEIAFTLNMYSKLALKKLKNPSLSRNR